MDTIRSAVSQVFLICPAGRRAAGLTVARGRRVVSDLLYIGLTFVGFGVLYLIVKGIETFER
jgi:hypothetical protein